MLLHTHIHTHMELEYVIPKKNRNFPCKQNKEPQKFILVHQSVLYFRYLRRKLISAHIQSPTVHGARWSPTMEMLFKKKTCLLFFL